MVTVNWKRIAEELAAINEEQGRMIRKLLGLLHQYSDIEESDIFEVQQMEGPEDPRAVKR